MERLGEGWAWQGKWLRGDPGVGLEPRESCSPWGSQDVNETVQIDRP